MSNQKLSENSIYVSSEIGTLRRLMIHSPDSGLGKVVPSKAQDWLFEDIIHLDTMQRHEYDFFVKILLYFLDAEKVKGKLAEIDLPQNDRYFYKPHRPEYFNSDKVVEIQFLLAEILENHEIKTKLVCAICAVERCSYTTQEKLLQLSPKELSKTLISGAMPGSSMIFPPVPNFIFTRDIGIVINRHILLNRPATLVRLRESLIMKYIFHNHAFFAELRKNIIEINDDEHHFFMSDDEKDEHQVTIEGGDVMTVSQNHILIGCSERTSEKAINQVITQLFEKNVVQKVSVVEIPEQRDFMHIDTVFTQVKHNVWVIFGAMSKTGYLNRKADIFLKDWKEAEEIEEITKIKITQFEKGKEHNPRYFDYLEDLLDDVSRNDLGSKDTTKFIYSGNNEFPFSFREQWTDSCNVLAIKNGVVVGYDRNTKTAEAFVKAGFQVITAKELLDKFEKGEIFPEKVNDTLIMLPSAELSRARGGSHCMSMPLLRDEI